MTSQMDPALEEILNREPGAEAPAPEAAAPPAEPAAPAAEEDPLGDLAGVPEDTKFDRAYVQKLRQEAASYRTKAKQYEAFESYDEADRKVWTQMAELYKSDPVAAAEYMEAIAQGIKGAAAPATPAEPQPGDDAPLTRAQVAAMLAERDNAAAVAAQKAQIEAEATTLGYEVGSRQYKYLIQTAIDDTGGDLQAAHAAIEAERQAIIDQYVGAKARGVDGSPVAPAAGAGAPPSGEAGPPKDWKSAREQLHALMEASKQ